MAEVFNSWVGNYSHGLPALKTARGISLQISTTLHERQNRYNQIDGSSPSSTSKILDTVGNLLNENMSIARRTTVKTYIRATIFGHF